MALNLSLTSFPTKTCKQHPAGAEVRRNKREIKVCMTLSVPILRMDLILAFRDRQKAWLKKPFSMQATMFKCCNAPVLSFILIIHREKCFQWGAGTQTPVSSNLTHLTPILVHSLHIPALQQLTSSAPAGTGRGEQRVTALLMRQGLSGVDLLYLL